MQFKLLLQALFCTGGTCTTLESVQSVTINSNAVILLDVILCGWYMHHFELKRLNSLLIKVVHVTLEAQCGFKLIFNQPYCEMWYMYHFAFK